jgi:hypothetical protein
MQNRLLGLIIGIFILLPGLVSAQQSLPVGMPVLEEAYRREQLSSKNDSLVSFTVRPIFFDHVNATKPANTDTSLASNKILNFNSTVSWNKGQGVLQILPLNIQQNYNSKLPYGWNNSSMVPAKGYQAQLSFGAYASYGALSVQIKPEFVYASNDEFTGFPTDQYDIIWAQYYDSYYNVTDIPEHYGDEAYNKLSWGQSSIRLNFNKISVGLSNENLWWGPGVRSSLLMSNNAPGFKHITINTIRPIETGIGSFEGQVIAGKLENSGLLPPEINRVYEGRTLYVPKQDDWRYISGFVLSYHPKWVPGLFIGASRTSQMYHQDAGSISDFIPLLQPFDKKNLTKKDRLSSLFLRWVWQETMTEIYGEYGHSGTQNVKDILYQPDYLAAYLFGMKKLIPLKGGHDSYMQASIELTKLQQTTPPSAGGWYTSSQVRQGYTNKGKVLGAGIGPGSNLQSIDISWYRGIKHIGLQFERYLHNNDFYYQAYTPATEFRKYWVDLSATGAMDWDYKNLLFSARISMIRSLNYQYVLYDRPPLYFVPGWDRLNFQFQTGITYRF